MKRYIAYFDFLGFKTFIKNNNFKDQKDVLNRVFLYKDISLRDAFIGSSNDNSSQKKINCINFSDTVVFWTEDDSLESLLMLLEIAFNFNSHTIIDAQFPVRGALVYEEIYYIHRNLEGNQLDVINSVCGKGIVFAHEKANCQDWAGTVIDQSIIDKIIEFNQSPIQFLKEYAKMYKVPYKENIVINEREFVLSLVKGQEPLNEIAFESFKNDIELGFKSDKKEFDNLEIKKKLNNTLSFLESFYQKI